MATRVPIQSMKSIDVARRTIRVTKIELIWPSTTTVRMIATVLPTRHVCVIRSLLSVSLATRTIPIGKIDANDKRCSFQSNASPTNKFFSRHIHLFLLQSKCISSGLLEIISRGGGSRYRFVSIHRHSTAFSCFSNLTNDTY